MRVLIRRALSLVAALVLVAGAVAPAAGANAIVVRMTGAREVPPADPDGWGTAVLVRKSVAGANDELCWTIVTHRIAAPTAAHVHGPATITGTASPVVDLMPPVPTLRGNSHTAVGHGCHNAPDQLLNTIWAQPASYYVNVHNATYPGGAVRGQLG